MAELAKKYNWERVDFGKSRSIIDIPELIDVQKRSYFRFLQTDLPPSERKDAGLEGVFRSVFPIWDFNETASLEYVEYSLGEPKYDVEECHQRGMTFAAPFKVTVRLVVWDKDEEANAKSIRDIKEQEVFFGDLPMMTQNGSFIINGTERVVVSQLHRSPGVFFDHDKGKTHSSGKLLFSCRVIPYRGSWLDFEFDPRDIIHVRIDRRRKFPATILLKALGYSTEELLNFFYSTERIIITEDGYKKIPDFEYLAGQKSFEEVKHPETGDVLVRKGRKFNKSTIKKMREAGIETVTVDLESVIGRVVSSDVVDPKTGEVIVEVNDEITQDRLEEIIKRGIKEFDVLLMDDFNISSAIRNTFLTDKVPDQKSAIIEIYRRLRPGDPPTIETAQNLFDNLFFNPERYDLSNVGRLKLNYKLGLDVPIDVKVLRKEDILYSVKYLFDLRNGKGQIDDIDHLGNRRVRAVGELLENQFRIGLVRMERAIKERMSLQEVETLMPHDLINSKPVTAVIKEFFGSSQLSQFMDQTNPLSEITHKRRLSALGPGGLTRERAGFEVRDVHNTHYGRICPIETPEGPNIGLIASLSTYARVNEYGFIETPYRKVKDAKVTDEIEFLTALNEEMAVIAQANAPIDDDGNFMRDLINVRRGGEPGMAQPDEINFMDVSPKQLVSVAASLIPFLENDDANRALMGSNMQRQAVPLLRPEAPLVGTGMERIVARDSGVTLMAKNNGLVENVDASRIIIRTNSDSDNGAGVDIYNLIKYQRSNQNTCVNQKPIVKKGDIVVRGQIIADGPAINNGELALGRNVIVAFMPWGGYNFEDSILISEKVVKEDSFTSIHIEEFELMARDTKLGPEEVTRDIPNVGEEALKNLDESGIVRIGAEVFPGDILIGKISPKGETQLSPEEKLLRAIFGEKAGDVRDSSLRVPPGIEGIVIGAKVFSRKGVDKDDRTLSIENEEVEKLKKDRDDEISIIRNSGLERIKELLLGMKLAANLGDDKKSMLLKKGTVLTEESFAGLKIEDFRNVKVKVKGDEGVFDKLAVIFESISEQVELIRLIFDEKINKVTRADELPPGVIKLVKVYVAMKRKLSVGDKMAGRHGNKGVLSRILPEEDLPYMEDGTPVEIVLNPLGVPSRMNVGQILETHLGWAIGEMGDKINDIIETNYSVSAMKERLKDIFSIGNMNDYVDTLSDDEVKNIALKFRKGVFISTPVFEGATEGDVSEALKRMGLPESGMTTLYDGRTGEPFRQQVTVGLMYILKLHHLVDDKIHARSIGPYSLVTQQPLGGKAQFGGQRLGEMEVWAMEAYGAAYSLQEYLTVKSDDVTGRNKMYESIVKNEQYLEPGLPESFNVLVKEMQSLGLDMELQERGKKKN
ncbi:MAG: DNA-directed RNA polymerase subunit beta [Deltaproteobacteria bacterium]|uniref:DNA-directed RNA polymerase subunit beta n=1 Tax=Candidatus Zymogenus saltonus TaxID=2844893 RepID=A0A9D8KBL5_9DELT|nr:DNA-directed RNA polymerase subunit beta [Candidatus Zymogenus saltonus]